eukprot:scaffold3651_cov230-Prasinococcus_capsulatus_cf.AAC.3
MPDWRGARRTSPRGVTPRTRRDLGISMCTFGRVVTSRSRTSPDAFPIVLIQQLRMGGGPQAMA